MKFGFCAEIRKERRKILKDILLDTFAKTMIGLTYLIGIFLLIGLIIVTVVGCFKYPMIVMPIVVLLLSYIIGREVVLND